MPQVRLSEDWQVGFNVEYACVVSSDCHHVHGTSIQFLHGSILKCRNHAMGSAFRVRDPVPGILAARLGRLCLGDVFDIPMSCNLECILDEVAETYATTCDVS